MAARSTNRSNPTAGRHRFAGGVAALSLAVTGVVLGGGPAHAAPECLSPGFDFDRDGVLDPVIGMPGRPGGLGRVQVRISNHGSPQIRMLEGPRGFGAAVSQTSSYEQEGDDDLCSVLLVGSPRETVGGRAQAG